MSYDYINDTFGEVVKTSPKYQEVEDQAIRLLLGIAKNSISYDEIFEGFEAVRRRMVELDDNTVRQGDPLWLSEFLAFHFLKWRDWYLLQKMYTEHPEQFNTKALKMEYQEIKEMEIDKSFFDTCANCLRELRHKIKREGA